MKTAQLIRWITGPTPLLAAALGLPLGLTGCAVHDASDAHGLTAHPGRMVMALDYQQIGDSDDGGGLVRSLAGTMALMTTNADEQARLSALAREPGTLSSPSLDTVELSGVNQWVSAEQLPPADQASQVRTFGDWRWLTWGDGLAEGTVALYHGQVLQFAWQGYGLSTTGPLGTNGTDSSFREGYAGPPAGTDLDGDGVPEILVWDYSGGAHCCTSVKHIVCSDPPRLVAQISGWHSSPVYQDLDGHGHYVMILNDSAYAYWNACFALSPAPEVIFYLRHGHYEIAGELMRRHARPADKIQADVLALQHELARYDRFLARNDDTNATPAAKPTAEEQADDDFFFGQAWEAEGVCIPPAVWDLLLELIYTGQVDATVNALDTMWPAGKPHKEEFANDLLGMVRGSWYGSRLPWFGQLEQAFARHYPLVPPPPGTSGHAD